MGARQEGDGHPQGSGLGLLVLPTVLGGQGTLPLHKKGTGSEAAGCPAQGCTVGLDLDSGFIKSKIWGL